MPCVPRAADRTFRPRPHDPDLGRTTQTRKRQLNRLESERKGNKKGPARVRISPLEIGMEAPVQILRPGTAKFAWCRSAIYHSCTQVGQHGHVLTLAAPERLTRLLACCAPDSPRRWAASLGELRPQGARSRLAGALPAL